VESVPLDPTVLLAQACLSRVLLGLLTTTQAPRPPQTVMTALLDIIAKESATLSLLAIV
jgi:hypothetical protein